jgi:hypothetical protein
VVPGTAGGRRQDLRRAGTDKTQSLSPPQGTTRAESPKRVNDAIKQRPSPFDTILARTGRLAECKPAIAATARGWLYGLLEFLRRPKRDLLTGFDRHGFPRRRVASHPSCTVSNLEDAEASQANLVTILEMTGSERHHVA